jgi:hypothetical protein
MKAPNPKTPSLKQIQNPKIDRQCAKRSGSDWSFGFFDFEIIWLLIVSDFVPSDSAFCLTVVSRLDIRNSSLRATSFG